MLMVLDVGHRVSLGPLRPFTPPYVNCSTPAAYVWAQPPTFKQNTQSSLVSSPKPITATFITLLFYYIPILSSYISTMYTVSVILSSFANTFKLESYLETLIQLHLHIFHEKFNQIANNMDKLVLDWHLSHQYIITYT
jgi:hypothetical protein